MAQLLDSLMMMMMIACNYFIHT